MILPNFVAPAAAGPPPNPVEPMCTDHIHPMWVTNLGSTIEALVVRDNSVSRDRYYDTAQFQDCVFSNEMPPNEKNQCQENFLRAKPGTTVKDLEGVVLDDPDPDGCHYGKLNELSQSKVKLITIFLGNTELSLTTSASIVEPKSVTHIGWI